MGLGCPVAEENSRLGRKFRCGQVLARWPSAAQIKQAVFAGAAAHRMNLLNGWLSMFDHDIV